MKNLLFVFGTRPEVIKLAPLILEFKKEKDYNITLCNTGQQAELSEQALSFFNLKSNLNLNVMSPNQTLSQVQSKILIKLQDEISKNRYDGIIIQGDTMSVFCGALATFYNKIPIFYVEAGLRTENLLEPFPEEAIRQMTARIATLNFAPTKRSVENMLRENIKRESIFLTGNTGIDALFCISPNVKERAKEFLNNKNINLNKDFVLVTCHRRENHGTRLENIIKAVLELSSKYINIDFIIPVHPNPNVKNKIFENLNNISNIKLVEPLDYPVLVELEKNAKLILTDSGGIQEEAPTFNCPLLVLRYETERPEGVEAGFAKLVGADTKKIIEESEKILSKKIEASRILNKKNPYGDGEASKKIVKIINDYYKKTRNL